MATVWGFSILNDNSSPVNKVDSETTKQSVKILDPNVELAFGWNRLTLRTVGLWPDQTCKKSRASLIMRYFSPILVVWLLSFLMVPQVLASIIYTFVLDELIEILVDTVGFVGVITRIIVLWYKGEVLAWCLSFITEDWTRKHTVEEQELMMQNARYSRRISIGITVLVLSLLGCYFFFKSVSLFYLNFDTQNGTEFGKQLLAPSYFPFDLNKRSNFALVWGAQLFAFLGGPIAYSSTDSFIAMLIIHLCGQITILRHALIKLIDNDTSVNSVTFLEKLAVIVKRHNTLTQLAAVIKDAVDLMLLIAILVYAIQLALQLFRLLMAVTEREPGQFPMIKIIFCMLFLNILLVQLLGFCYVGDMLIQESEALGLACYSCKWYNLSDRSAKDLMLVMHRARAPLQIWAGPFVPFSLELYGNVLKTSMGYFSLLLTMKERAAQ